MKGFRYIRKINTLHLLKTSREQKIISHIIAFDSRVSFHLDNH